MQLSNVDDIIRPNRTVSIGLARGFGVLSGTFQIINSSIELMDVITGFGSIATPDSRALVLGTAPSVKSLAAGQYYAHPRNQFWKIMSALFDDVFGDYDERVQRLERRGVALWDVLHEVERQGSLDSAIVRKSCVPNDIGAFLGEHPLIHAVFFNGAEAERLFGHHFAALLVSGPRFKRLPSTSPANASLSFDEKLTAWTAVRNAVG